MKGLLVDYKKCTGCGKCVAACEASHSGFSTIAGIKISVSGPFKIGKDREITYYIPSPTELCDGCNRNNESMTPECVKICEYKCLTYDDMDNLKDKLNQKTMAVFSLE